MESATATSVAAITNFIADPNRETGGKKMSDWVHCNYCYTQPAPGSGKVFYLTNCGHIYCQTCVEKGAKGNCKVCGSVCTTIQLSSHMKPEVEMFFTDPWQLFSKQSKQLLQVIEFQKSHRQRLQKHQKENNQQFSQLREITNKYNNAAATLQRLETELGSLQQENLHLKGVLASRESTSNNPSRRAQTMNRSLPYQQPPSSCGSSTGSTGRRPNAQSGNHEGVQDQTPLSGVSRNRTPLQSRLTFQPTLQPTREPTSEPLMSGLGRMSHIRALMNSRFTAPTVATSSTIGE